MELINRKFIPIVVRHSISGLSYINSEDSVFDDPLALAMVIDVFSERGYHAVVDVRRHEVPNRFDLDNGQIYCLTKKVYRFRISYVGSQIRRGR